MLKKTITFEDFNGDTVTEDHYFHLSKADLVELEVSHKGGLSTWIQNIVTSEDGKAMMEEFKRLLLTSYGKKSEDGRRFIKNEQLREDFLSSPAYDSLFMELVTDAEKAAAFINSIIPKGLDEEVAKMQGSTNAADEADRVRNLSEFDPLQKAHNVFEENTTKQLTLAEVREMDADELKSGLATGKYTLPQ